MQRKEIEVVPDRIRCVRSDGKGWRCSARSMPDKNICQKHYFQARRRYGKSVNSASPKKMKTREEGGQAVPENRKKELETQHVSGQFTVPVSKNYGNSDNRASPKKMKMREQRGEAVPENRKNEVEKQHVSEQALTLPVTKKSKFKGLRCTRSDGKRWRCSAMPMPNKTVCEKHYFQAKRRHENAVNRARQKKMKRREQRGEAVPENKKNEVEKKNVSGQFAVPVTKNSKSKTPSIRIGQQQPQLLNEEAEMDKLRNHGTEKEPDIQLCKVDMTPSRIKTRKDWISRPVLDCSSKSTDTSVDRESTVCHQCQKNDRGRVVRCSKCKEKRYPELREEDIDEGGDDEDEGEEEVPLGRVRTKEDEAGSSGTAVIVIEELSDVAHGDEAKFEVGPSGLDCGEMGIGGRDDVFKAYDILSAERDQLRVGLVALEVERAGLQTQVTQYQAQLTSLQQDRDRVATERDGLQTQVNQYQTQLTSLQKDRNSVATEKDGLQTQVTRYQIQLTSLQQDRDWVAKERDGLQIQATQYQAQLTRLQQDRESVATERDWLQTQVTQNQAQLTSFQQDIALVATERDWAMAQVRHLQSAVDQLSKDIQREANMRRPSKRSCSSTYAMITG